MREFILGYVGDSKDLKVFDSPEEADHIAEEWVSVQADSLEEAKSKYEQTFLNWKRGT